MGPNNSKNEPFDVQERALGDLGAAIDDVVTSDVTPLPTIQPEPVTKMVTVDSARRSGPLLTTASSDRDKTRVLFISDDLRLLDSTSTAWNLYNQLAHRFDEMHIIVTAPLSKHKQVVKRVGDNIWLYTTAHVDWFTSPNGILRVAKEQLVFLDTFRPDFIIATSCFEDALGAYLLAKKYDRPFQIHITKPFWSQGKENDLEHAWWRKRIAAWVLRKAVSVRVVDKASLAYITKHFPQINDVAELPRHFNVKSLLTQSSDGDSSDMFPNFRLVFTFMGRLDYDSTLYRAIDAVRQSLKSPADVLVVVGDGPVKEESKKRAEILGIGDRVVFKPASVDVASVLRSSDVLIVTDIDDTSDDLVIKAAAFGVPLVIAKNKLRSDLFTHGEDAMLCDPESTPEFEQAVAAIVDDLELRERLRGAKQTVQARLVEDTNVYLKAYYDSLESVFTLWQKDHHVAEAIPETDGPSVEKKTDTAPPPLMKPVTEPSVAEVTVPKVA